MQVTEAIQRRRSIRKFTPQAVEPSLIREIFSLAQLAPSNCNTQPWHVTVVSGQKRQDIEQAFLAELMSGKAGESVFTMGDASLDGIYKERQIECAMNLWNSVGITRADKQARQQLMARNWKFFDAPHVAFIGMNRHMVEMNALDIGIYVQTLMLLMTERGVDCCPQGAVALHPEPLYELLNVPREIGILCGVSFGYAEKEAPVNNFSMSREPLESAVNFID